MPPSTLTRSIHFFQFDAGLDNDGNERELSIHKLVKAIRELNKKDNANPSNIDKESYWTSDSETYCAWVEKKEKGQRRKLIFAKIKRHAFPLQEINFELKGLNLPKGAGIAELIHIVLFPNNIIGFDYNADGPRIHKFREYLNVKLKNQLDGVALNALLRKAVEDQLKNLSRISLFKIKLKPSFAKKVEKANISLFDSIHQTFSNLKAEYIDILVKLDLDEGRKQLPKVVKSLKGMLNLNPTTSELMTLDIKGQRGLDTIHLMNSRLVCRKKILTNDQGTNAVASTSAFEAIEEAYSELADEIKNASSINLYTTDE